MRLHGWIGGLLAVCWILLAPAGLALPVDEPITYPELVMEENLLPAATEAPAGATQSPAAQTAQQPGEASLEMDENVIGATEEAPAPEEGTLVVKPLIGGVSGRNSMTISTVSTIRFATPFSEGVVNFTNPEGSTVNVQYLLTMNVADILRVTGRTGYAQEEYEALSQKEGFTPESERITVGQTKGIPPGKRVHTITLGTLPDGSALGRGTYPATVIMAAFDPETNQRAMVGAEVAVTVEIASDQISLTLEDGKAALEVFTPADEPATRYSLIITQRELMEKTGRHGALGEYQAEGWVTLWESQTCAPGAFLSSTLSLRPLPDGTSLPKGSYEAWLARSVEQADGQWALTGADTQVLLTVND